MDKIWYRNPSKSEVIGRYGGDEKIRMTTQNRQKSNAKKQKHKCSRLQSRPLTYLTQKHTASTHLISN